MFRPHTHTHTQAHPQGKISSYLFRNFYIMWPKCWHHRAAVTPYHQWMPREPALSPRLASDECDCTALPPHWWILQQERASPSWKPPQEDWNGEGRFIYQRTVGGKVWGCDVCCANGGGRSGSAIWRSVLPNYITKLQEKMNDSDKLFILNPNSSRTLQ